MKKFDFKSIILGIIIGTVGLTTVTASTGIKQANFNDTKVIYNGEQLELNERLVSVQKDGQDNSSNYMPVRAVLEAMEYEVGWDGSNNAILINETNNNSQQAISYDFNYENVLTDYKTLIVMRNVKVDRDNKIVDSTGNRVEYGIGIYNEMRYIDTSLFADVLPKNNFSKYKLRAVKPEDTRRINPENNYSEYDKVISFMERQNINVSIYKETETEIYITLYNTVTKTYY